jgi:tripartite-type tricarboxylate transporter receptor subunit TctC
MNHVKRLGTLLLAFTAAGALAADVVPSYPSRPIRLVAPFAPGGGTDVVARLVAQRLTETFAQQVIIDNRPGAGTMIGTEIVAKAPPDGYTFLICAAAHSINPSLYSKVNYHPLRDFAAITMAVSFPFLFVVHPSVPAQNVQELIAAAKTRKLTFASSGTGNTNHLAGEFFKMLAGVDIAHIPYKGGGPALTDVVGGQVSMMFGTVLETLPQAKAGKVKALAVSSAKRASFAPDLPTVGETLRGFEVTGWYAFLLPGATPAAIVDKLNREITRILDMPEVKQRLVSLGSEPWPTSPQKASDFIAEEAVRWAKVIKRAGLKPD